MKMKKRSFAASSLVLALLVAGIAVEASPPTAASAATASTACTPQTNPFSVTGAIWGTSGSPMSAYPGDQNVPLTITMLFSGPCTSPQASFFLSLASTTYPFLATLPLTGPGGVTQPKVVGLNSSPNTFVTETFYLNIDQSAATGVTYNIPMTIQYSNNTASDVLTEVTTVPITLYGPVQLNFGAETTHLVAGAVNNVTISISNSGSATSGPVSTTVTAPAGITLLNQLATTTAIDPGSSATQVLQLFASSSVSGTAFVITFTAKYLDAYSNSQTMSQTLGFTATSSTVEATSIFAVEGASWGSAASAASPTPGTQDTPIVVSLQYLGSTAVTSLQANLQLPTGITDLNGHSTAAAFSSATTNQYGAVTLTFYLNIATTAKPGSYNFTLSLEWMTSQSPGLSQTAVLTPPPIAALQSSFQVESSTWGSTSTASSTSTTSATAPVPGTSDASLIVTLQNLGTTSVTNVKGSLTLPAGITDLNGQPTATAYAATASPSQVVTLTFNIDLGSSVKPGSYAFPLELSWLTSLSISLTQSGTVSPPPIAAAATTASFPLSVTQQNSTVTDGSQTSAGFTLTNGGTSTIYSPTFSLSVASPVVLSSTGSPVPAPQVAPGATATFSAHITSGPTATPGFYSGTLTVVFADSNGASHTQSFPVVFTVKGTVTLILQNTAVSQTATGFTVTGSILNEGGVPAYYASITGLLGVNTATPVYVGEIDPNTPLPFSVTIPFTAPAATTTTTTTGTGSGSSTATSSTTSSASVATASTTITASRSFSFGGGGFAGNFTRTFAGNGTVPVGIPGTTNATRATISAGAATISLTLTYKDTFGTSQLQSFPVATTIRSASQLSGGAITTVTTAPSSNGELKDIAYGVVAVVLATLVVGAFMLRRHRSKKIASLPPEQRGDQSVI